MSAEISIDFEGLDEALKKLRGFNQEMRQEVAQGIGRALQTIANAAKATAPVDTGRYRASIGARAGLGIHEVRILQTDIVGRVGTRVKYAPYIEFGRRAGRMPPVDVIEEWAGRHGMAGAGYVIARAIGRRGIRAKHILENAAKSQAENVVRIISTAISSAVKKV